MSGARTPSLIRMPMAGLLAWLIPGLGHIYLGQHGRGIVCLVTISATFWTGVAVGGVQSTVDPTGRKLWFMAQLCTAVNTVSAYAFSRSMAPDRPTTSAKTVPMHWESADVGIHYTGVAGLLNLLVIFDAIARADPSYLGGRNKRGHPERST